MKNRYTISVLFVNYEDFWSKVVYYILGKGYGHAAIGIDDDEEIYYSFNMKGFRREKPRKHEHIISKSICYKLRVSKEEYERIAWMIEEFQRKRFMWRYNLLGMLLSRIRISRQKRNHYFCSEFVAEMLQKSKIARFNKNRAHYLPYRLEQEIQKLKNIDQVILNPIRGYYY